MNAQSPPRTPAGLEQIVGRVRGEFAEMPGLRLTPRQAQRLWHLDEATCLAVMESLVHSGFLVRTGLGVYARLSSGALAAPRLRMAKAAASPLTTARTPARGGSR